MSTAPVTPVPTEQDWRSGLPDDLKSEKSLETIKDIPALAKSFVEGQKMIGSSVRLPKADAPDEEWGKVYTRLGRPEKPEGYELKRPENLPEGVKYDEELETAFKGMAHEAGLHPRQAQRILDKFNTLQLERHKAYMATRESAIAELKKEWGPNYDKQLAQANRAIKELGDQKLAQYLEDAGLANDPMLVRVFAKYGASLGEDTLVAGDQPLADGGGQSALQKELETIRASPEYKSTRDDNAHRTAVARASAIYKQLYPEPQA